MTEILLTIITLSTLGLHVWYVRKFYENEKRLMKAILSKDVSEFTNSELAERPQKREKEVEPDLIPESELDDEQFFKAISKTVE